MKQHCPPLWLRVTAGITLPLILCAGLLYLYWNGSPFVCVFYQLTGLYCPGCGAGRAVSSLLHGNVAAALKLNLLLILALPFVAYYLIKIYIQFVFQKDALPFFIVTASTYNKVMWCILIYWVLRNIPFFPFTLLAP